MSILSLAWDCMFVARAADPQALGRQLAVPAAFAVAGRPQVFHLRLVRAEPGRHSDLHGPWAAKMTEGTRIRRARLLQLAGNTDGG
jgi:hypothetical protein